MKNVIIAFSLFAALGASAQTKTNNTTTAVPATQTTDPRVALETAAQKDLSALITFTPVSSQTQRALKDLFITKHNMLKDVAGLSSERKSIVTEMMENRLSLLLEPASFEKLKANKDLYSSLIN